MTVQRLFILAPANELNALNTGAEEILIYM